MAGPAKQFDRDQALARAADVFWSRGYEGTRVEHLLEAMDLSRSSLYATFGDKRALFLEALQMWLDRELTVFLRHLSDEGPLHARLMAAFMQKHKMQLDHGNDSCLFGKTVAGGGMQDPDVAEILRNFRGRLERVMRREFERAIQTGELPPDADADALAKMVVVLGQGVSILTLEDEHCFEAIAPTVMKLFSPAG
ncbi:MAG: TetR/AcrR family transcriptional regulator [Myxococcota bacterium]